MSKNQSSEPVEETPAVAEPTYVERPESEAYPTYPPRPLSEALA
jgi:hypothetical protein